MLSIKALEQQNVRSTYAGKKRLYIWFSECLGKGLANENIRNTDISKNIFQGKRILPNVDLGSKFHLINQSAPLQSLA